MQAGSKTYTMLSEEFHFTDYQIKLIRYRLLSLVSEVSKTLIMGILFYQLGYFAEYLFAVTVLLFLRTRTGGIHLKHYTTCLLTTAGGIFSAVCVLPLVPVTKPVQLLLLFLCFAGIAYAAPVVSCYRPEPDGISIRKSKVQATVIICIYAALLYVIPENPLMTVGFWIIILQSAQLVVAKFIKQTQRRRNDEKVSGKEVDVYSM